MRLMYGKVGTRSDTLFEISHADGKTGLTDGNCEQCFSAYEFDAYKADIVALRKEGEITEKTDALLTGLCGLMEVLAAVHLEKTTKMTNKNSSILPSQTGKDETKRSPKKNRDTSKEENSNTGENFETVTVEVCNSCGSDLSDVDPSAREERVLYDISYTVKKIKLEAEVKDCPECHA